MYTTYNVFYDACEKLYKVENFRVNKTNITKIIIENIYYGPSSDLCFVEDKIPQEITLHFKCDCEKYSKATAEMNNTNITYDCPEITSSTKTHKCIINEKHKDTKLQEKEYYKIDKIHTNSVYETYDLNTQQSFHMDRFVTEKKEVLFIDNYSFTLSKGNGTYPKEVGIIDSSLTPKNMSDLIIYKCNEEKNECVLENSNVTIQTVKYDIYHFLCGKITKIDGYVINNVKEPKKSVFNWLTIVIIVVAVLVIAVLAFFLIRKCRKNREQKRGSELKDDYVYLTDKKE